METETDFTAEYHQARERMGKEGTDLVQLTSDVSKLYLKCPQDIAPMYEALLTEIQYRKVILTGRDPFTGETL